MSVELSDSEKANYKSMDATMLRERLKLLDITHVWRTEREIEVHRAFIAQELLLKEKRPC